MKKGLLNQVYELHVLNSFKKSYKYACKIENDAKKSEKTLKILEQYLNIENKSVNNKN